LIAPSADRTLLLIAPTLACLAAFALPTLQRSMTALIDWFTLLFFSGCGLVIWVVWLAMQTGVPAQPAANVRRLVPGFEPGFGWLPFLAALAATAAWIWLVSWRAGRHRDALWKSLVLPASGAAMSWLLLMTLWLPLLNYVRSDMAVVRQVTRSISSNASPCVAVYGVTQVEAAALSYHGRLRLVPLIEAQACGWLIVHAASQPAFAKLEQASDWQLRSGARRRTSTSDELLVFQRQSMTR
jgi:4-amino-4-deoxy-L-arabinose transferase-like glycosyltransferase